MADLLPRSDVMWWRKGLEDSSPPQSAQRACRSDFSRTSWSASGAAFATETAPSTLSRRCSRLFDVTASSSSRTESPSGRERAGFPDASAGMATDPDAPALFKILSRLRPGQKIYVARHRSSRGSRLPVSGPASRPSAQDRSLRRMGRRGVGSTQRRGGPSSAPVLAGRGGGGAGPAGLAGGGADRAGCRRDHGRSGRPRAALRLLRPRLGRGPDPGRRWAPFGPRPRLPERLDDRALAAGGRHRREAARRVPRPRRAACPRLSRGAPSRRGGPAPPAGVSAAVSVGFGILSDSINVFRENKGLSPSRFTRLR